MKGRLCFNNQIFNALTNSISKTREELFIITFSVI